MNQTRAQSFVEACLNTLIGFGLGFACQLIAFPLVGVQHVALQQNIAISLIFTIVNVCRGYAVRRWCNAYLHRLAAWIVVWFERCRSNMERTS